MTDRQLKTLRELIPLLRVEPGSKTILPGAFDPRLKPGSVTEEQAADLTRLGMELLADYQTKLAAQQTHALLVVLQGLDAAGKDSTIKHVMSGLNPQGVRVESFKVPSAEELGHDYFWRYVRALPQRGQIGIFNRSHYEEVLVVRVHPEDLARQKLPPEDRGGKVWKRRYREINDWERYLVDNGIRVVKLFLNVSKEEQRRRFLTRIDQPDKNWKFSASDVRERRFWGDYQRAYAEILSSTSTPAAPWYVVPADHKWFARLAVTAVLVQVLEQIDPRFPKVEESERKELAKARSELEHEG